MVVLGLAPLGRRIASGQAGRHELHLAYTNGAGVLRQSLVEAQRLGFALSDVTIRKADNSSPTACDVVHVDVFVEDIGPSPTWSASSETSPAWFAYKPRTRTGTPHSQQRGQDTPRPVTYGSGAIGVIGPARCPGQSLRAIALLCVPVNTRRNLREVSQ